MFFSTVQTCPARACGAVVDVFLEVPEIPDTHTTFIFECPTCRNRIFFPIAAVCVVDAVPENATLAKKYIRANQSPGT